MDFEPAPMILAIDSEYDAEKNTGTLFVKAQCKKCFCEFEWSEKVQGLEYIPALIVQDLCLDATYGICTRCRIRNIRALKHKHEYIFKGACSRENEESMFYLMQKMEMAKGFGPIKNVRKYMSLTSKYLNSKDKGKLYKCTKCGAEKEEYK